jgi:hypothetical protein
LIKAENNAYKKKNGEKKPNLSKIDYKFKRNKSNSNPLKRNKFSFNKKEKEDRKKNNI